jgi:hypothetical protein
VKPPAWCRHVVRSFREKQAARMYRKWKCEPPPTARAMTWEQSLRDPTAFYRKMFQEFHHRAPSYLREHRAYFIEDQRGFGEDAFHMMWWHLLTRFRPARFLEIGVYRGQVLSLVSLIAKQEKFDCHVCGISPFSSVGDTVSAYRDDIDYLDNTLANFKRFGLPQPELIQAYSSDGSAQRVIASRRWDMIYIDGNHDYDAVRADWQCCAPEVAPHGLIVLDDAGLDTRYAPPRFATAGHPGPSRWAKQIAGTSFRECLQVGHNRVFQRQPA